MPGPRDPWLTPYVVPWERAVESGNYLISCMVTSAQSGKTDSMLDLIGARLDQRPTPIIYVGPSREFNTDQFEPRLMELFSQARGLGSKLAAGKRNKKTLKYVSGVRLRLAHAGSSTALKSDPAALALIDEYDEMLANVKKQGDPLGLVKARGDTFADFAIAIASTPSQGWADVTIDEKSGLEFWRRGSDVAEIESQIWRLYQQGTMFHWTWPCPFCGDWFVPRMKLLRWPKGASPAEARVNAWVECPHCHAAIAEEQKATMNARALPIAPGQWIEDGEVRGEPAATSVYSLWVSGLCSPFKTFGDRAEDYLTAEQSGDPQRMQTVCNASFGELFAPGGGEVPEWREVMALRMPYARGTVPEGVVFLTAGIDVQKNRLVYSVRGWGMRATSWLIDEGELWGETDRLEVWADLDDLLGSEYGRIKIKIAFIDSGFRPGKVDTVPEHRVYEFCRAHQVFCFPTKGSDLLSTPFIKRRIEVTAAGTGAKYGLELVRLSTDFWKLWVHERIRWPKDSPGAWHLHEQVDEGYAKQIVSEARTKSPAGRPVWVQRSRENHFFDAECLNAAAGFMLGAQRIGSRFGGQNPVAAAKAAARAATEPRESAGPVVAASRTPAQQTIQRFRDFASRMNR